MVITLNIYVPLSSAYSTNSMNIVLFFIRECDVDNCIRHTQSTENTNFFRKMYELRSQTRYLNKYDFDCCNPPP